MLIFGGVLFSTLLRKVVCMKVVPICVCICAMLVFIVAGVAFSRAVSLFVLKLLLWEIVFFCLSGGSCVVLRFLCGFALMFVRVMCTQCVVV